MDIHTRREIKNKRSGKVNKMYATFTLFIISCLSLTDCITTSTVATTEASTSISTNYSGSTTPPTTMLKSDTAAQTTTTPATTTTTPATTTTTTSQITLAAPTKEPLSCYSCAASRENDPCLSAKLSRDLYGKSCPQLNQTRCMILSVTMDGNLLYYQRDCHDGAYFPQYAGSPLFVNLVANNKTTCDLITTNVGKNIVCYRPCETDFCNGPALTQDECQTLPSNKSQNSTSNNSLSSSSSSSSSLLSPSCAQRPLLRCYGCAGTIGSDECVTDISGMLNTSLGRTEEYSKNCSSDMDRCMIIYRIVGGKGETNYYQRDCHDGTYFPANVYSSKLVGLPTDNQTYCTLVKDDLVCYISCATDFCNGPQPNECDQYKFNTDNIPDDSPCSAGVTRVRLIIIVVFLAVNFMILH